MSNRHRGGSEYSKEPDVTVDEGGEPDEVDVVGDDMEESEDDDDEEDEVHPLPPLSLAAVERRGNNIIWP